MPASDRLPHVDEHSVLIDASVDTAWDALLRVAESSFASPVSARGARLLGCVDVDSTGPRPLAMGSAFPGFHVATCERPTELALAGRHRFSDYALVFRLDSLGNGRARLRAETRASFPGIAGSAYRTLVIGTRIHVLVTRRLLGAIKQRAERSG